MPTRSRQLLEDPRVRAAAGRADRLPPFPPICHEINELFAHGAADVATVAALIETDATITGRLLKVVNSPYFGLRRKITSIQAAVSHAGLDAVRDLVMAVASIGSFAPPQIPGFSVAQLQRECVRAGRLVQALFKHAPWCQEAFTAALLHDIGQLVLAAHGPAAFGARLAHAKLHGLRLADAERARSDVSHADVGAYLLGLWGMPADIVEAVRAHHDPIAATETLGPIDAVKIVLALLDEEATKIPHADLAAAIDAPTLVRWRTAVRDLDEGRPENGRASTRPLCR